MYKKYIFVHDVQRTFSISGDHGQSVYARTWYPKNFQETEMSIGIQVANQYEYDKLVEFVQNHHRTILAYGAHNDSKIGADDFGVEFMLFKALMKPGSNDRQVVPPMHLLVVVTDIQAGHERFVNAPTATLTCRVLNDFRQLPVETSAKIYDALYSSYMQTFGTQYKPAQDASSGINSGNDSQFIVDDPNSWYNNGGGSGNGTGDFGGVGGQ